MPLVEHKTCLLHAPRTIALDTQMPPLQPSDVPTAPPTLNGTATATATTTTTPTRANGASGGAVGVAVKSRFLRATGTSTAVGDTVKVAAQPTTKPPLTTTLNTAATPKLITKETTSTAAVEATPTTTTSIRSTNTKSLTEQTLADGVLKTSSKLKSFTAKTTTTSTGGFVPAKSTGVGTSTKASTAISSQVAKSLSTINTETGSLINSSTTTLSFSAKSIKETTTTAAKPFNLALGEQRNNTETNTNLTPKPNTTASLTTATTNTSATRTHTNGTPETNNQHEFADSQTRKHAARPSTDHKPNSDDPFIEKVLLAMRSSRPKTNDIAAGAQQPPQAPTDGDAIIKGLKQALHAGMPNGVAASPKPPVPPQTQNRLRKQIRLVPKQRERSPQATGINGSANGNGANNYDSDDGLFSSTTTKKIGPPNTNSTAQRNASSVYGKYNGVSSTGDTAVSSISSVSTTSTGNGLRHSTASSTFIGRSPSPALSVRSTTSSYSTRSSVTSSYSRLQTPPRRVFPQTYTRGDPLDVYEMRNLESSPVVFDANMSFVLGCKRQPVHQSLRPSPSYEDPRTSSAYLSEKIQNFLRRTDHVQEEWSAMGRKTRRSHGSSGVSMTDSGRTTPTNSISYDDYDTISLIERQRERHSMERGSSMGRTRSSQNILTKAFQLSKTLPHTPTSRRSMSRFSETDDDDRTIHEDDNEFDELSEMTVDLAEERSAANIATERLEAETAERLKLERELTDQQGKVKNLQETTEKLEMELICAKSDLNGISEDEDVENESGGNANAVYKLKYERVARELEFTKRRLQTQHEHDLEQLVGLKKQLEKKLSDAYEEVEEQRQVVTQWKRKAQKMTNEMNDLRMLLEEQNGRNNLLEKKQRKFDAECQSLQDAARHERQAKDRFSREKDVLIAEKFTLEQTLADTRLELDLKEEKLASLQRELEEMTFGGGTEEEIAQLRRSKNELDRRVKEQEEELDEMAGQVQLLEQAKLRLEMTLETMRKEARREAQQRDDELEEARGNAYKKIKALECQLETEHEERTLLLREKHELERRLSSMEDQDRVDRQAEEAATQKLKRDLRKYKALLKDAQAQLERLKTETSGKALIRQLRNQLEDAESARTLAMKSRQAAETELAEVQAMFEEAHRARNEAEDRANAAHRDRAELQAQIEENEEELAELMKKYTASVKQLNTEQIAVSEYEFKLSELEAERNNLREQVAELQQRLENVENMADPSAAIMSKRLELRTKELESRLELEQATRARLDVQVNRHKEALEKVQNELAQFKGREMQAQDALKKSQKSLRDMREEFHVLAGRDQESITKRKDLEKKVEQLESEGAALKNDLRLALQRIADLQQAMEEGDDDDDEVASDSDASQSSDVGGSLSDLEDRLKPIKVQRSALPSQNGESKSTTRTLVFEREDNSPRN